MAKPPRPTLANQVTPLIDAIHLRITIDNGNVLRVFHDAASFSRLPLWQPLLVVVNGIVNNFSTLHGDGSSRGASYVVFVIVLDIAHSQWNDTVVATA